MKYKAAAIVMFSNDLVELFTQLLDRITADHEQPHLHTATFIGSRGATIVSILQPVLASLLAILEAVIEARDTEFQDLSVLPALLRTHSLLSLLCPSSVFTTARPRIPPVNWPFTVSQRYLMTSLCRLLQIQSILKMP